MELKKKTGYIFIKTASGTTKRIFEDVTALEGVIGAWAITGEYDIIAWVNAASDEDLYRYANTVRGWQGVEFTNSHLAFNANITSWASLNNPNGAWVRLRVNQMGDIAAELKKHEFIGAWANIPGDYDFLVWTYGNTTRETLENVLLFTEGKRWQSSTHIPVYAFVDDQYRDRL